MLCSWTIQECPNTFNPFNIASISLVSVNISRGSVYKASEQIVTLMWLQVLTAVQRVLGAVRMQQQRDTSRPSSARIDSGELARPSKAQRVLEAERGERAAQQAVKALQKKEAGWEAELGATQMKNNQLHKRVRCKRALVLVPQIAFVSSFPFVQIGCFLYILYLLLRQKKDEELLLGASAARSLSLGA